MDLSIYDPKNLDTSIINLSKHVESKETFTLCTSNMEFGTKVTGKMAKKMNRRSYYKDCVFDYAICKSIGFTGSKFINTIFRNCDFENGNLHSCDFRNVLFEGHDVKYFKMENIGFHKSTFTDCTFKKIHFFSCGFTDVIFYNSTFLECKVELSSLENAQFINCRFIKVNLSALNLEFTEFNNIYALNTTFPFTTISSAFGLLQQLPLLDRSNTIYSAEKKEHKLSIPEYFELIKDFEIFYIYQKNYYALANIYISTQKSIQEYETINTGILNSIKIRDYRFLYHFCKLVYQSNMFTIQQRRNLFENITLWISRENLSVSEYHNYQVFMGTARDLLLNCNHNKPTAYFYLKTNINPNEIQKQVILLSVIDDIMDSCKIPLNSIELRHNSDYIDFLTVICDNIAQFSRVLIMIYSSLAGIGLFASGIKKIVEAIQNTVLDNDQHIINKLEQEKLKLEISSMRQEQEYKERMDKLEYNKTILELQKSNLEIENMQIEANRHNQILSENGIVISVGHTSRNLCAAPIPEMMQYNQ